MAAPARNRKRKYVPDGFDVTCVIGRVEFVPDGPGVEPPHVEAYKLIAQHDAPGTYTFPLEAGGTCRVTVEHEHEGEVEHVRL